MTKNPYKNLATEVNKSSIHCCRICLDVALGSVGCVGRSRLLCPCGGDSPARLWATGFISFPAAQCVKHQPIWMAALCSWMDSTPPGCWGFRHKTEMTDRESWLFFSQISLKFFCHCCDNLPCPRLHCSMYMCVTSYRFRSKAKQCTHPTKLIFIPTELVQSKKCNFKSHKVCVTKSCLWTTLLPSRKKPSILHYQPPKMWW